jgi:hypothetical protein
VTPLTGTASRSGGAISIGCGKARRRILIMALAARPRTADAARRIKELNTDEVFAARELYEDETGNVWIERVARVPLVEVRVPAEHHCKKLTKGLLDRAF